MDYIGPFTFQAIRCFLGVLTLLPVIFLFDLKKKDGQTFISRWRCRKLWTTGFWCGCALFVASGLQQVGLIYTDAGKAGFLTAMYIVIVPFCGLFFRKKIAKTTLISVVVAVAGLYLISGAGISAINIGDILILFCAVAFAVQITLIDRLGGELDGLRLNCIQCLVCASISAVIMLFTETIDTQNILACTVPLLYAGCLSMGAAYSMQILGQQKVDSVPAALIMSLESVFAVLSGWLLLQERLTPRELGGCVLLFCAVILSQLPVKSK
jgi:drug/metabolite transporter (DMT)-like permease